MSAAATAGLAKVGKGLLRVRCESNGAGRDYRVLNLTTRGAFIESFVPFATGSSVNLQFNLPNGHPISVNGRVNYHQFKVGFGVEFTDLSSLDKTQISGFAG